MVAQDFDLERDFKPYAPKLVTNNSNRWTLWVSMDVRCFFDQQKNKLLPACTHGVFVEFLLSYRNYLDSRGELPPFFGHKKHPYSKSSTSNSLPPMLSSSGTLTSKSEFTSSNCWGLSSPQVQKGQNPEYQQFTSPDLQGISHCDYNTGQMEVNSGDNSYYNSPSTATTVALIDDALYDITLSPPEANYYLANDGSFYFANQSQYARYPELEYYTCNQNLVSPDVVAAVSFDDLQPWQ